MNAVRDDSIFLRFDVRGATIWLAKHRMDLKWYLGDLQLPNIHADVMIYKGDWIDGWNTSK